MRNLTAETIIARHDPCLQGAEALKRYGDLRTAWLKCSKTAWLSWLLQNLLNYDTYRAVMRKVRQRHKCLSGLIPDECSCGVAALGLTPSQVRKLIPDITRKSTWRLS